MCRHRSSDHSGLVKDGTSITGLSWLGTLMYDIINKHWHERRVWVEVPHLEPRPLLFIRGDRTCDSHTRFASYHPCPGRSPFSILFSCGWGLGRWRWQCGSGFFLMGHQVSVSQDVFCAMYKEASRVHQERGLPSPRYVQNSTRVRCLRHGELSRNPRSQTYADDNAPIVPERYETLDKRLSAYGVSTKPRQLARKPSHLSCPPCPTTAFNCRFHAPMEFPGLMSWALAQKLTIFRATIIMARGTYEHAWPGSGLVVTPSVTGW